MSESLEFDVHAIAAGGDGVGRAGELVVFAPRTAPGDRVRGRVTRARRFGRATGVEILRPSNDRVDPPCLHYVRDACGGCQLQHLSEEAQRRAKSSIIHDAFLRIARRDIPPPEIRRGASPWRYRSKLTLALRRAGDTWIAGLHRYDDPRAIFALDDCLITDERVMAAWRGIIAHASLLPAARELRASVRLFDDGVTLVVEGEADWRDPRALLDAIPALIAIWSTSDGGRNRRLVASRASQGAKGHGASFTQVNAGVAGLVRAHVLSLSRAFSPVRVIDAYAGVGDTAEPLAHAGARVMAIERDHAASRACAARLPPGSEAIAGAVEDTLSRVLPADLVVLNPPRAGVDARVTEALERAEPRPAAIIYASCDPATLARDVARLPSYRVASVVGFDMFPQTAHLEAVCELGERRMKIFVTVNGEEHEVLVNGDRVTFDGAEVVASVSEVEGTPVRLVTIGDAVYRMIARPGARRGEYAVRLDGYRYEVDALDERARTIRRLSTASAVAARPARLVAPMPGLIVRVNVRAGDDVVAGQGLVVMEAMKMENELRAPAAGRVKDVRVAPGTAVEKGAVLIDME